MTLFDLKVKITSHLRAGYPGLFIQSGEEARVDAMLQEVATQLQLHPKEWNLGYGWVDFYNKQPRGDSSTDTGLASSLPVLLDDDLDGKLFIIKDARSALEDQPLAVARLKQLLNRIQRHHRSAAGVVLVSETLHIPAQIEAQITLLPLPLPSGEEISTQLDSVCRELELLVPETTRQRLQAACSGLSQEEIRSAMAMVRQQHEQVNDGALALIQHEKEQIIAKSGVLEMLRVSESTTSIGGLENLKVWLSRRAQIFRRLGEARDARVQAPKGVLIAGMPGCGKSLTAKAAAGLFQLPLLRLDIGSLLGKYVGESEHNMRRALAMAESVSPCILWIDELEKAFVGMNSGSGSEVSSRLFGYFLTWMQEKTGAVFVIATANNITALPPELLRKGRFDEVFYVGFPNAAERGAILDIHLDGEPLELKPEQRSKLITQSRDYAGADIQNAINEAREMAFLNNRALKLEDLEAAIELTVPLRETLRDQVAKYEELFDKLKLKPASTCDGLSVAQMIQMADSHNALRREQVANSEDCPDDLLEKLAGDVEPKVRTAVFSNPNCPEHVLTLRINIEEGQPGFDLALLHLACMHAHAPHDLLAAQFERLQLKPAQRLELAEKSTDMALMERLLGDEEERVHRTVARNGSLSAALQSQVTKASSLIVRNDLAANKALHPDAQALLARDESFQVRETLASLDHLIESVQMILLRDEDSDVRIALAKRSGEGCLPEAIQLELAKEDVQVREALASNASLGAAAQLLLAQDPIIDVRLSLARHASLATATLQYLLQDVKEVQARLAGNPQLESALLQMSLSQHEEEDVRRAIAGNEALNVQVQARLVKDRCPTVRAALAGNRSLADKFIDVLLQDKNDKVRQGFVCRYEMLSPSVQLKLAIDTCSDIRVSVASASTLPENIQDPLANDIAEVLLVLAENTSINAASQLRLLVGDLQIRRKLASNSALSGPAQARLAEDADVEVRTNLAGNPALVAPVADKLICDVDAVLKELASNQRLNEAQYAHLYKSGSEDIQERIAGNPKISEDLMARICREETIKPAKIMGGLTAMSRGISAPPPPMPSKAKLAVASNRELPPSLQMLLTEDNPTRELLQALASNPRLTLELQEQLSTHKDANVREKLAANSSLHDDIQHALLKDTSAHVRAALLHDWRVDRGIELQLAQDSTVSVRRAAAARRRPSKTVQVLLARDLDQSVRARLLHRENLFSNDVHPLAQLILAHDSDLEIRKELALYSRTIPSVQLILAEDESAIVRKALAQGRDGWFIGQLDERAQMRLARDQAVSVRAALAGSRRLSPAAQAVLANDPSDMVREKANQKTNAMWRMFGSAR